MLVFRVDTPEREVSSAVNPMRMVLDGGYPPGKAGNPMPHEVATAAGTLVPLPRWLASSRHPQQLPVTESVVLPPERDRHRGYYTAP